VPVIGATWLAQESTTQPFSMACASEGTLDYRASDDDSADILLAKVTSPKACPSAPISNDRLDLTVDW
jgi:tRNA A37 threonylcarbamoyladenosine synthetase subunit TsaC/SUA5/YrdC